MKFDLPDFDLIEDAVEQYDEEKGTDTTGNSAAGVMASTTKPAEIKMEDGTYSIEVNMVGGSGRASVSSPSWFIVKDGKAYARLLWSSPNYDYMIIGGEKYENETTDGGNSTFTIPITVFDKPFSVVADTTAMDDPVEIEYALTFYKDTIAPESHVPQEAAKRVILIALAIIIIGGVLNIIVKKRRKQ